MEGVSLEGGLLMQIDSLGYSQSHIRENMVSAIGW